MPSQGLWRRAAAEETVEVGVMSHVSAERLNLDAVRVAAQACDGTRTVIEHVLESDDDNLGSPVSSPEQVSDDDIFADEDFEALGRAMGPNIGDLFWEVEEALDVEEEGAAPRRVLGDPGALRCIIVMP